MKHNRILFGTLLAASLLCVMPGCDKLEDFGDTNQNPNATTAPTTSALLTNVLAGLGDYVFSNAYTNTASTFAQYISETQYTETSRYATPQINFGGVYSGSLNDLQNIINYNSDEATAATAAVNGSNANQIATARILKAYMFWYLTDAYGDIPYTGALEGNGILEYTPQSEIYPDLIKELKEAVDQFDNGAAFRGDILFNGDIAGWKKFANSVRLLIALRMSKVDAGMAQTETAAALSHPAGVMETTTDDATIEYPGGVYPNPRYRYYYITKRFDYALSATVANQLNSTGDRRANAYGTSTVGFPYGLTRDNAVSFSNANPNWAYVISENAGGETDPLTLIGSSDIWLARAEVYQRGWATGVVATAYTTGIQRSWERWGVYDAAAFNTYISSSAITITTNPLVRIQNQQWLSFFPNGIQGWSNWRRTGVPTLTPAPGTNLQIPRRLPYGPDEFNLNRAFTEEASARYTAAGVTNSQDARVWWDVN